MVQERKGKLGIYCNKLQEDMNTITTYGCFLKIKLTFLMSSASPLQRKILLQHNQETKDSELTIFKQLLILIEKCHPYDAKSCNAIISTTLQPWIGFYLESVSIFGPHYEATTSRIEATVCLK